MDDFEEKPKAGPPSFFQNASHFQVGNMEIKQVEGDYHDYSSKNIRNTYSSGNNYYNNYKDSFNQTQTTYNGAVQNGGTYTAGPTYNVEKVENGNFGDNYGTMYQNPVDAVKQLAQRQRNDPGYSGGYGGYGGGGGFGGGPRGPQPYPSPPPDPQYGANRSQPMGAAPYDGSPSQPKYGPYGSVNAPPSGGPPSQPQYGSYGSANSPPLGGSPPPPRPQYGAYGSANSPPLSGSPPRPQYGRYGSANSPPLGGSTPHNNGPPSNSPYGANRSPPMGGSALFGGAPPQAPQHGTAESPPPPQGGPVPFKGPKKATNPFYSNGATGYTSNGSTEQQSRHQPQHPPAQAPANSYGLARRNPFLPAQPQQPQQQRPGPQPIYDQFTESDPDLPRPHGKAEGAPSPPPANLTVPPVLSHTSSAPGRVQPFESWKEHESHGAEPPAAYPPPGHPHVPEAPVSAAPVIAVAGPLTQSPESVKWAKQTKETAEKARETEPEKEKEAWPGEARYKKKMQEAKLMMERADSVMSTTTTTTTSMTSDNSDSDMDSLDDDGYGIGTGRAAKEAEAKKEKKRVQDPARGWSQYSILNEPKTDAATGRSSLPTHPEVDPAHDDEPLPLYPSPLSSPSSRPPQRSDTQDTVTPGSVTEWPPPSQLRTELQQQRQEKQLVLPAPEPTARPVSFAGLDTPSAKASENLKPGHKPSASVSGVDLTSYPAQSPAIETDSADSLGGVATAASPNSAVKQEKKKKKKKTEAIKRFLGLKKN